MTTQTTPVGHQGTIRTRRPRPSRAALPSVSRVCPRCVPEGAKACVSPAPLPYRGRDTLAVCPPVCPGASNVRRRSSLPIGGAA